MKKIKYLILLIPLLSGCYNYRELDDIAITTAISIDYIDNNYNVIAEVINPTKQQDASSANNSPFINYSASGSSLQEAFRNIVLESPRQLYAPQLELIVISEEVATNHLGEVLEFFSREPESRTEVKFLIARGEDSTKVITLQTLLTGLSSSNITKSLELQKNVLSLTTICTINDLLNMYLDPTLEIKLPTITIYGNEEKGSEKENVTTSVPKASSKISSTAIFKDKVFLDYLDNKDSTMLNLITNELQGTILNYNYQDSNVILELYRINTGTEVNVKDNKVTLNIKGYARIKEVNSNINIKDKKEIENINILLNSNIEKDVLNTFNNIRDKYNTDVFNFRQLYYKTDPTYYKENYKDNWYEQVFKDLTLEVKSSIKIYEKGNTLGGIEYESKNK